MLDRVRKKKGTIKEKAKKSDSGEVKGRKKGRKKCRKKERKKDSPPKVDCLIFGS